MQTSSKKRQQFAISIRRKQITQKLQSIRSQYQLANDTDYQKYLPLIPQLASAQKPVQTHLRQLKILSYSPQPASLLHKSSIHLKLYQHLTNLTTTQTLTTPIYNDILTILINLCVHQDLQLTPQIIQITTTNILVPDREIISLWFIANVMYQKSVFSGWLAKELVGRCDVVEYMEKRIGRKFQGEGDIVIFGFFCCGFLGVAAVIDVGDIKRILAVIVQVLKYQPKQQENYWYLTQALVDYGSYIHMGQYQLFTLTPIIQKLEHSCKNKKSKYIKNYLKMLINFAKADKVAYQKMLKYGIFTQLSYCVQNRLHQVKKLCADLGLVLLEEFQKNVDIENIPFFSNLTVQLLNLQKYPAQTQTSLLKYTTKFLTITISNLPTKQSKQNFITQLLNSNTITTICKTLTGNQSRSTDLLTECLNFLFLVIKIDENYRIGRKLMEEKVAVYLSSIGLGVGGNMGENQGVGGLVNGMLGYLEEIGEGQGSMI